jgi:hypothetical protein
VEYFRLIHATMIITRRPSGLWWAFYLAKLYGPFDSRNEALEEMIVELSINGHDDDSRRLFDQVHRDPEGGWVGA